MSPSICLSRSFLHFGETLSSLAEENEILNDKDKLKVIVSQLVLVAVRRHPTRKLQVHNIGDDSMMTIMVITMIVLALMTMIALVRLCYYLFHCKDHHSSMLLSRLVVMIMQRSIVLLVILSLILFMMIITLVTEPNQYQQEIENHHDQLENENLKRKKLDVVKTKEDAVPLPYPFPLPKHFSSEIEGP